MTMAFKRGELFQFNGQPVEIRDFALLKQDNAHRSTQIRISQLGMASKRIADDEPELAAWFCLVIPPYREFAVEEALKNEGVDAFVATFLGEPTRRRGRVEEQQKMPVLPGYVMVRCVPSNAAIAALRRFRCPGRKAVMVTGIIGSEAKPYIVPRKYMSEFIAKASGGAYDERPPEPTQYRLGEQVKITAGPFASFDAIVTAWNGHTNRIEVEVGIFGRATPIDLDVADVEKV